MLNINNYMHRSNVFKVYLDVVIFCLQNRNIICIEDKFHAFLQCLRFHDQRIRYLYSSGIMVDQVLTFFIG